MTAVPGYQITVVRGDQDTAEITGDEWGFSPLADRPHAPDLLAWLDAHTGDTDPDVWAPWSPPPTTRPDACKVSSRARTWSPPSTATRWPWPTA